MENHINRLRQFIRSPSENVLFALSSLIFVSVLFLAIVTVLCSGIGRDKTAQLPSKPAVIHQSTGLSSSSKVEAASSTPSAPPTPQSTVSTPVQTVPSPSSSTCPQSQDNQEQALREAQLKQEAENQKEAERLKTEYEEKGYQVNIIIQEGE